MNSDGLTVQQVATCVRVSLWLWKGKVGPKGIGNTFSDLLFVRDDAFILDIAADLKVKAGDLWRELREANDEGAEQRRARAEALAVAEKVCGAVAQVRNRHPDRWGFFEKIVRGQSVIAMVRRVPKADKSVARASVAWVSGRIKEMVDEGELEKLLTFRNIVG